MKGNEPAFPCDYIEFDSKSGETYNVVNIGLTKREVAELMAMMGLLSDAKTISAIGDGGKIKDVGKEIAQIACNAADAMCEDKDE